MESGEIPSSTAGLAPEGQRTATATATAEADAVSLPWKRPEPVTLFLVAVMTIITVLTMPQDALSTAIALGAKHNESIRMGQWWRLLSSVFLHSGFLHLAFNVYALLLAGTIAERAYGHARYLALFVIAGICASSLSFRNSEALTFGASGAIFGILGSLVVSTWRKDPRVLTQLTPQGLAGLGVWAVGSFVSGNAKRGVDNAAHLGGILSGGVASLVLVPDLIAFAAAALSVAAIGWTGFHVAQVARATRISLPPPQPPVLEKKLDAVSPQPELPKTHP
jgi:rhomboid protease GluP